MPHLEDTQKCAASKNGDAWVSHVPFARAGFGQTENSFHARYFCVKTGGIRWHKYLNTMPHLEDTQKCAASKNGDARVSHVWFARAGFGQTENTFYARYFRVETWGIRWHKYINTMPHLDEL